MCQLCCFKVWSRVCTEIIEISQDGLVETPSLFVCSFRKLKFFKAQLFVFISGQCLATVWQAAVALVSFPSRLMLWKTLAYQKYQKYHWSALWCCPHPGGNSARTASCENVDFARGGRQIKVSRAFISWFMRWHKLHHCYAPSLLRTVVTRTWSCLYFRGCKFGLLITFADYERGMGWEHWMHFSSRLPMQSVFFLPRVNWLVSSKVLQGFASSCGIDCRVSCRRIAFLCRLMSLQVCCHCSKTSLSSSSPRLFYPFVSARRQSQDSNRFPEGNTISDQFLTWTDVFLQVRHGNWTLGALQLRLNLWVQRERETSEKLPENSSWEPCNRV